jgi:hypothetical protein
MTTMLQDAAIVVGAFAGPLLLLGVLVWLLYRKIVRPIDRSADEHHSSNQTR